ncbi:MAG: hypothetical protein KF687_11745 [Cyclobacteriaceae bacterium]|nr:hypothetical protein [Cyclobacteriaceae bacterium]
MKQLIYVTILLLAVNTAGIAQEVISDEELQKYAIAMDSIDGMRKSLIETISEMVKTNENITAARYNELSRIIKDEEKLAAANATQDEVNAVKEILATREEGTAKINETFQSLAKDYIGAASYNKIKKALTTDEDVKLKYETMLAELKAEDSE